MHILILTYVIDSSFPNKIRLKSLIESMYLKKQAENMILILIYIVKLIIRSNLKT